LFYTKRDKERLVSAQNRGGGGTEKAAWGAELRAWETERIAGGWSGEFKEKAWRGESGGDYHLKTKENPFGNS